MHLVVVLYEDFLEIVTVFGALSLSKLWVTRDKHDFP